MKIYILLILCVLFWSGNFIVGRYIHNDISPIELAFYRWEGVFLVILPLFILHYKKIFNVLKKHYLILFTLGTLSIAGFNTFIYIGLQYTTATNALIINSFIPILILILLNLLLKQKIHKKQLFGIILSTFGVLYLVLKGKIQNIFYLNFNKGDLFVLLAALDWALYSVLLKFKPKEITHNDFFITTVFIGVLVLLPFYAYTFNLNHEITVIKNNFWAIFYVIFFPSILSYLFWNKGIAEIGATKTGQFIHLMPVFGILLAVIFLKEHLKIYHFIGIFLIGAGIYISLSKKKALKV